jgi:hypothetical protein
MVFIENAPSMTVISSSRELPHRFFEPGTYARYQPNHPQNSPPGISNDLSGQLISEGLLPLLRKTDDMGKFASEAGTGNCQHPAFLGGTDIGAGKTGMDTDERRGHNTSDENNPPSGRVLPYCPTKHLPYSHCHDPSAVPPVSHKTPHRHGNCH